MIVYSGYPGGCEVPSVQPSATSSPLSPPPMEGDTVLKYISIDSRKVLRKTMRERKKLIEELSPRSNFMIAGHLFLFLFLFFFVVGMLELWLLPL
jgi:hypothetical protein